MSNVEFKTASEIGRYVGIGLEDEFGVESTKMYHFHSGSSSMDSPTDTDIATNKGAAFGESHSRGGRYSTSGSVELYADINSMLFILYGLLSGYEYKGVATDGDLHTHVVYGKNTHYLPSWTLHIGKDGVEHKFLGNVMTQAQITFQDDYVKVDVEFAGQKDEFKNLTLVSDLNFVEEDPFSFLDLHLYKNGEEADVKTITLDIQNNVNVDKGYRVGKRHPVEIPNEGREITVSYTTTFEDIDIYKKMWGGSNGPSKGSEYEDLMFHISKGEDDSSDQEGFVDIILPKGRYTQVQVEKTDTEQFEQQCSIRCMRKKVIVPLLGDGTDEVEKDTMIYSILENKMEDITDKGDD